MSLVWVRLPFDPYLYTRSCLEVAQGRRARRAIENEAPGFENFNHKANAAFWLHVVMPCTGYA